MKLRLAVVAARRLEEHRKHPAGPVPALQKALWEALQRGDFEECTACVKKIDAIRGPQPPSPLAQMLIERINRRFAAQDALREKERIGLLGQSRPP